MSEYDVIEKKLNQLGVDEVTPTLISEVVKNKGVLTKEDISEISDISIEDAQNISIEKTLETTKSAVNIETQEDTESTPTASTESTESTTEDTPEDTPPVDTIAPTLNSISIDTITDTSANLNLKSDESSTIYYVILPSNATAPTVEQVLAAQDSTSNSATLSGNQAVTENQNSTVNLTSLSAETIYIVYFVATDSSSNKTTLNSQTFTTTAVADTTAPTVTFSIANNSTNIDTSPTILLTFSEEVRNEDNSTITDITSIINFKEGSLSGSDITFSGSIDEENKIITLSPSAPLTNETTYYITLLENSVEDFANNRVDTNQTISFTTIASGTLATPQNLSLDNSSDTGVTGDSITKLTSPTITWSTVTDATDYNISIDSGTTWSNTSGDSLALSGLSDGNYTILVKATDGTIESQTNSFEIKVDTVSPTATIVPINGATEISVSTQITATFNELVNSSTINSTNFKLEDSNADSITSTIVNSNNPIITLTPNSALTALETYTISVENIEDIAGNSISTTSQSFTAQSPTNVDTPQNVKLTIATDSGSSSSDGITNNQTPEITWDAVTGATYQVSIDNGSTWSSSLSTNSYTPSALSDGTYTVLVKAVIGSTESSESSVFTLKVDTTAPTVSSSTPTDNATEISVDSVISVTFDENIDSSTVDSTNFAIDNSVTGSFDTSSNPTVVFTPSSSLATLTNYTVTLSNIKDVAGNTITTDTLTFTTQSPTSVATPQNVKITTATDSGSSDSDGITNNQTPEITWDTITGATYKVSTDNGSSWNDASTNSYSPSSNLIDGNYTVLVKAVIGSTESSESSAFSLKIDTTAPTVSSSTPSDNDSGVAINSTISATFSESVDTSTINSTNFSINNGVTGSFNTSSNPTVVFTPSSNFSTLTNYTATFSNIKDLAGNTIIADTIPFTTASPDSLTTVQNLALDSGSDSGLYSDDNITNDATPTINWDSVNGATTYYISFDNGSTWTDLGNIQTYTTINALVEATHNIKIVASAGDVNSSETSLDLTVDLSAPTLTSINPLDGANGIDIDSNITLVFNEKLDHTTIDGNITLGHQIGIDGVIESSNNPTIIFNPNSSLEYSTNYGVSINNLKDLAGNQITSAINKTFTTDNGVTDSTAPTVTTYSPIDNATEVLVNSNLVLTFDETINKGVGNITIKKTVDNSTIETIDVTNSSVVINSNEVTINPTNNLDHSTEYYVQIDSGAFKDSANNNYIGISDNYTWSFTTDEHANECDSASLIDINTSETSTSYINAAFDISGDIDCFKFQAESIGTLKLAGVTMSMSYSFYDNFKKYISPTNHAIDINPNTYYLKLSYSDTTGSYTVTLNYTKTGDDVVTPTITKLLPLDDEFFTYPSQDLNIIFSENISASSGAIKIYDSNNNLVETINASDTTIEDNIVTINPTNNFNNSSSYYIKIDSNAFTDLAQNSFSGIDDSTSWNFTTIPPNIDSDEDYIPDDIESSIGMDSNNPDEDGDGVLDGLNLTGSYGDTFFDKQWHIKSLGNTVNTHGFMSIYGQDLNLLGLYHKYMGYNIIVQVVDDGVDADHEDLTDNIDITRSYYGSTPTQGDPSPDVNSDTHGTKVAGIIGARALNGKGVRGIAPFVKIAGSNYLSYQNLTNLEKVWYSGNGANDIAITNNSWGSYYNPDTLYESILNLGTTNLRDGKGRIYVFSAGNDRQKSGSANLHYTKNNRYGVTVAAVRHDNTYAVYSTSGSNILVSGYAGDYFNSSPTIGTTTVMGQGSTVTWDEDTNKNYTFGMNGTSAAAPVVSGSLALVLEACPNLTWRDIKYLIAKNATQIDTSNNSWVQNSAGLYHSVDYGYGLINPSRMVDECTNGYTNLPSELNFEITENYTSSSIPDNDGDSIEFTIDSSGETTIDKVEWVEVTVDSNHTMATDLKVDLTSPSGTKTELIHNGTMLQDTMGNTLISNASFYNGGHRLSSAAFYDESGNGNWKVTVTVTDLSSGETGNINSIKLKVYGH